MASRLLTAAAVFCLLGGAADAQSYLTTPLGGGFAITNGPNGGYFTAPLGDGSITTGPNGFSALTTPLGDGSITTITGGVPAPYYPPRIRGIGQ